MNSQDEIEARHAVNSAVYFILTNSGTTGADALARVLLHVHDHNAHSLDITDLCALDEKYEAIAWTILQTRVAGIEPHELAGNKARFDQVISRYAPKPADNPDLEW